MVPADKTRLVKELAYAVGFDHVGVTRAAPPPNATYYRRWLAQGHAGSMTYLHRNVQIRSDPRELLAAARSLVCVALNYRRPEETPADKPPNPKPVSDVLETTSGNRPQRASAATGRIAQYARGRDYHVVMRRMMRAVVEQLRDRLEEPFEARVFVDTGPLLEREFAAAAGLGWVGKNTLLLNERLGSYLFLGELLTTLDLEPDRPVTDHCGTCTRCLEACPTDAFPAPYQLDASRCISYFTIEHRGEVPAEFHADIGDWIFGCDVCQEVCPFNKDAPIGVHSEIMEHRLPARLPLLDLLQMTTGDQRRLTRGSAADRARPHMWRRNAAVALGASESTGATVIKELERARGDDDVSVRQAARESLSRLGA